MDMMSAGAIVGAAMGEVAGFLSDMPASSGSFTVNKDNVLAAAKIIDTQALSLQEALWDKAGDLRIQPPGHDDISKRVAMAWNDRLVDDEDSYEKRVQQYVDSLYGLVQQLSDTAKAYGYTDEEVAAAFGARSA
jgi:hypothetical protein